MSRQTTFPFIARVLLADLRSVGGIDNRAPQGIVDCLDNILSITAVLLLSKGKFMKRLILGMSKSKSDLGSWIEDHAWPVMVALAQLYLFPYGPRVHWRKEVWEKLDRMHVLKHNNKLPSADFILDNSWNVNKSFVADAVQYAIDKEENYSPRDDIDVEELAAIMESYFEWVASILSKHIALQKDAVLDKLDELGLTEKV